MANTSIFARARPKEIRLREAYNFTADVSTHPRTYPAGTPLGRLEIFVPYCGDDNFPQEAVADIEHQCPDLWQKGGERQVRIGYVGCSRYDHTDLAELFALSDSRGVLPIDIPVGGQELANKDSLRDGCRTCLLTQDYAPHWPDPFACTLDFGVLDEDDLSAMSREESIEEASFLLDKDALTQELQEVQEALQGASEDQYVQGLFELLAALEGDYGDDIDEDELDQRLRTLEDEAEQRARDILVQTEEYRKQIQQIQPEVVDRLRKSLLVRQDSLYQRSLNFRFEIILLLPASRGQSGSPELTSMSLDWPSPTSQDRLSLTVSKEMAPTRVEARDRNIRWVEHVEKPVWYVPEKGAIQWGPVEFEASQMERSGLKFATPVMTLSVEHPGELYPHQELAGRLEISLPRPLSDLEVEWFGADGAGATIPIVQETVLNLDFVLHLEDRFRQKLVTPYRHLQFEGVILDEMRIADIRTILENQGLRVRHVDLTEKGSNVRRYQIWGRQMKGAEPVEIWLWVEGTRALTKRQREIPGGQTFTTEVETGQTTIYMRGRYQGDSKHLTTMMNAIHQRLKRQFPYVSTVD